MQVEPPDSSPELILIFGMMLAMEGGSPRRFRKLVDRMRAFARQKASGSASVVRIRGAEHDEVTREHARQALEWLDRVMVQYARAVE